MSRGVRDGRQLAPPADPHVAGLVRPARVEQRDVGRDRRHEQDRPRRKRFCAPSSPCGPSRGRSRATPRERHERHALLGRLQRGVDRRAGGVPHLRSDSSPTASVKRGARPASPSDTALDSTSATQPAPISRSAHMPRTGTPSSRRPFGFSSDQRPHHFHRRQASSPAAARAARRPESARARSRCKLAVPPTVRPSIFSVGWPTPTGTLWPSLPQVPMPESSCEVVADHGDARERVGAVADQRRALHRVGRPCRPRSGRPRRPRTRTCRW